MMNISTLIRILLAVLVLFPFAGQELTAQVIDEKEVQQAVMDGYNRRFRRATEPVWEIKGTNYLVSFNYRGKENIAEFDPSGKMIIQRTGVEQEELRPNTQKHLRKNFRGQVMRKGEYIQEMPNKRYYQLEMVPRRLRDDPEAPVTLVRYTNTGQFMSESTAGAEGEEGEEEEDKIELPQSLTRDFNRKARNAMDVVWTDVDTALRADYTIRGNEAHILYTHEGEWIKTTVKLKTKYRGLHQGIQRWFDENIDAFDYLYAEDVSEAPRNRFYVISIIEKADKELAGDQDLLPTRIYFTRAGRHVATFYPDYELQERLKQEEESRRWQKLTTEEQLEAGATGENISHRELPTKAQTFLSSKYDHEWRFEVCRAIPDNTHGMLYQVVMRLQGRDDRYEHYFDIHGNLIEDEDY
jgi:hypothetical protein